MWERVATRASNFERANLSHSRAPVGYVARVRMRLMFEQSLVFTERDESSNLCVLTSELRRGTQHSLQGSTICMAARQMKGAT